MTVLTITVPDEQAAQIKKMLSDAHVINIEEAKVITPIGNVGNEPESALDRIKKLLAEAKGKDLFKDIEDPSEWQRNLRKEWERDF